MNSRIKRSVIAGTWYPGNPSVLRAEIKGYLANVHDMDIEGKVLALVAPHAGYAYSGQVAAYAYNLVQGRQYDAVVVIGPSHRFYFAGASVWKSGAYETPLGAVPVAEDLAAEIIDADEMIGFIPDAHTGEHSVEIQLPFLQVVLDNFSFVPIVMGTQDYETCERLSSALYRVFRGKNVLVIASSDLSHYRNYETAVLMDSKALGFLKRMDARGFMESLAHEGCEACGAGPIIVAMLLAQRMGADRASVLKYLNSGDVTGDRKGVVGYASLAFYVLTEEDKAGVPQGFDSGLSGEDKTLLLRLARKSVESALVGELPPNQDVPSGAVERKMGAFVTLKKNGELRGCIGTLDSAKPLIETVRDMASAAAFRDPRFMPVTAEELEGLSIEISVLTPFRRVRDIQEIEVGRHGLLVRRGIYSGLLLPQVAVEHGMSRMRFLEETCRKAGLPPDAWKEKSTEIYIFSADIFSEG